MRSLSYLDLNATPPFNYAHDHFGFRDRLSQPVMKGSGEEPTPGSGAALEPGEFILGYPDEDGPVANLPEPEVLSRNGSYMAYRRLQEHVGVFRDYLRENADTPEGEELLAAKFMGRWRSGAPLVLAPDKDDPELGADPMRNNDFNYKEMDPLGYACPLGSHARRLNPRDTAHNMNRRRMIRRGATYGPALPDDAPDDGVDRGIAAFIICANLVRQFEFAQNVWINDKTFHELGNEHDPICGTQDGTLDFTVPKRPIRKVHKGIPAFTTLHGRGVLLPAGDQRAALPRHARQLEGSSHARSHLQPEPRPPRPHRWAAHQHLLDVELSLGSATGSGLDGEPVLHHHRGAQRPVAGLRDAGVRRGELPAGHRGHVGTLPPLRPGLPGTGRGGHRAPGGGLPAHRPSRLQAADRRTRSWPTPTR